MHLCVYACLSVSAVVSVAVSVSLFVCLPVTSSMYVRLSVAVCSRLSASGDVCLVMLLAVSVSGDVTSRACVW